MGLYLHLVDAAGNQIMGGATDPNAQGGIEVINWQWGASFNPKSLADMIITKSFDIATVPLLAKANSGEVLSGMLVNIDPTGITVQRVDLEGVTVQGLGVGGTPVGSVSAPPSEEAVTLRYNVIRFYSPNGQNNVALSGAVA